MNITGTVVIDLSDHVDHGLLHVGDRQVRDINRAIAASVGRYTVDIGTAQSTSWDPRVVMLLAGAESVEVIGRNENGVGRAVAELQAAMNSVPGPRSAS